MTGKYKIADFTVIIDSVYDLVHKQCSEYIYEDTLKPEICIKTSQQDIDVQRERMKNGSAAEKAAADEMSDEYIESLAVCYKFCGIVISRGGLAVKGCSVLAYGMAYIFIPDCSTENFTDKKFKSESFGKCCEIINKEISVINIKNDNVFVYSLPWYKNNQLRSNEGFPLKAICILNRDLKNHVKEITASEGYACILRQCLKPESTNDISDVISSLNRILRLADLYSLGRNMESISSVITFEKMKKNVKNIVF